MEQELELPQLLPSRKRVVVEVLQLVQLVVFTEQDEQGYVQLKHESSPVVEFLPATVPVGHYVEL